jgi:hypothetical protein
VQPRSDERRTVAEELVVREDAQRPGIERATSRELVVVARDRDDRETRGGHAPHRGDAVDAATPEVDDRAADERLFALLLGLQRDVELGLARERLRRATGTRDGLDDAR